MKYLLQFTLLLISLSFATTTFAQRAGSLDTTFNHDGIVYNTITGDTINGGNAMAIQSDGKIVVAGYTESFTDSISHCAVVRYNTDGSIDTSFNKTGYVVADINNNISSSFCSVVIQSNGKILALGSENNSNFILERFNVNGTLDTTFGSKGIALTSVGGTAASLVLQSNGEIVAGGSIGGESAIPILDGGPYFELVRCDTTGKIDSTFGSNGIVTTGIPSAYLVAVSLQAIAIQSNGKIVAAGYYIVDTSSTSIFLYALTRYNTDGSLDSSFGSGGIDTPNIHGIAYSVAIQTNGEIVVGGCVDGVVQYYEDTFTVVRFNSNGSFDTNFGTNGIASSFINGYATSLLLQPDDKIVAAGIDFNYGFSLLRLNTNGTSDTSFGVGGEAATTIVLGTNDYSIANAAALQSDGKIVAAGLATDNISYGNYFAVARYNNDISTGILQLSSAPSTILVYPNPVHNNETLDYTLTNSETLTINLYDITGRIVKNFMNNEKMLPGDYKQQLNFEKLPAGTYILTISNTDSKTESVKIIKQ